MRKFNNRSELLDIIRKYVSNRATSEEKKFLETYYDHFEAEDNILNNELSDQEKAELENRLEMRLMGNLSENDFQAKPVIYRIKKLAIAATVLIALSISLYLYKSTQLESQVLAKKTRTFHRIVPGGNRAVLTLSDGSKIDLDGAAHGEIAKQTGISISKTADGKLVYTILGKRELNKSKTSFNTIETPKGGEYQVNLPDGTRVWLNAATSLRYPANFSGPERKVELNGEAYFEVAPNRSKPFRVVSKDQTVEVLGTHFNINSYADEAIVRTSLLEGSIKVSIPNTGKSDVLKPGQESKIRHSENSITISSADVEESIAWKNGYFTFTNENIKSIMRKVSRWYDVDIEYSDNVPQGGFGGRVSKTKNISEILKILELTKEVRFKIEGRRVMVMR